MGTDYSVAQAKNMLKELDGTTKLRAQLTGGNKLDEETNPKNTWSHFIVSRNYDQNPGPELRKRKKFIKGLSIK